MTAAEAPPAEWSATENVEWKTEIPGRGWASPCVADGRVLIATVVNLGESEPPKKGLYFGGNRPQPPESEHQWKVLCLDLEKGHTLWEQQVHAGSPETSIHLKNSFASETPATDGQFFYVYFGNVGVYCFDLAGNEVWSKRLEPHVTRYGWGTAASPVVHGNHVYVVNDNEEDSYLLALDKHTGEEVWRVSRDEKSNWSTPFIWENDVRTEIVTPGTDEVRSYDLDGKELWTLRGMSSITIATPFASDGLLYLSSGYVLDRQKPIYAIRPRASGDITLENEQRTNDWIAWSHPQSAPYNPTSLLHDGRLYVLYDRGLLACFDAEDGTEIYPRKRVAGGTGFTASPWAIGNRIFCLDEDGVTHVVRAGDEFEVLYKNVLADDDMGMATPVIVGDRLLIRTSARLYSIRSPQQ